MEEPRTFLGASTQENLTPACTIRRPRHCDYLPVDTAIVLFHTLLSQNDSGDADRLFIDGGRTLIVLLFWAIDRLPWLCALTAICQFHR